MKEQIYTIHLDLRPSVLDKGSWYKRYVKTITPKFLKWLTVIIFIYCILYFFWFTGCKEIFPGAAKIGEFTYPLLVSYLAAFIFFFVTVHYPKVKRRGEYVDAVYQAMDAIILYTDFLVITPWKEKCGYEILGKYPTQQEWEKITLGELKEGVNWQVNLIDLIRQCNFQLNRIEAVKDSFPELEGLIYGLRHTPLLNSEIYLIDNINSGKPFKFNRFALEAFVKLVEALNKYKEANFVFKRPPPLKH